MVMSHLHRLMIPLALAGCGGGPAGEVGEAAFAIAGDGGVLLLELEAPPLDVRADLRDQRVRNAAITRDIGGEPGEAGPLGVFGPEIHLIGFAPPDLELTVTVSGPDGRPLPIVEERRDPTGGYAARFRAGDGVHTALFVFPAGTSLAIHGCEESMRSTEHTSTGQLRCSVGFTGGERLREIHFEPSS